MAKIAISDLRPTGYGLFSDSESYMTELTEDELGLQGGGISTVTVSSKPCLVASAGAASYIKGRWL